MYLSLLKLFLIYFYFLQNNMEIIYYLSFFHLYKIQIGLFLYFFNFNTNNFNNMSCMFVVCSSLISLNLSNFNTNNVQDMSYMFNKCYSLISLNLSNFIFIFFIYFFHIFI